MNKNQLGIIYIVSLIIIFILLWLMGVNYYYNVFLTFMITNLILIILIFCNNLDDYTIMSILLLNFILTFLTFINLILIYGHKSCF